jgi:hypothetical protein
MQNMKIRKAIIPAAGAGAFLMSYCKVISIYADVWKYLLSLGAVSFVLYLLIPTSVVVFLKRDIYRHAKPSVRINLEPPKRLVKTF